MQTREQSSQTVADQSAEEVLRRVDLPIESATGLPNEAYTTDAAFIEDREKVISPGWACIAFVDQLPEQNYALPVDFMGLPLLITRDVNNDYRVFHNVCSHRGMKLADKPCANNGAIRCPYHSWTYALNGDLRATPNLGGVGVHTHELFEQGSHGLKVVRSEVWLGSIFINLSGTAAPFYEYIASISKSWAKFLKPESLQNFYKSENESHLELTVKSNWKLAVENFLESYHLPSVHPDLNRISPLDKHYDLDAFDSGAGQGSLSYTRLELEDSKLPAVPEWPEDKINCAEYPALFPNTFLGIHADQLFIQYLQPIDSETTREHVRIFYFGKEALDDGYREHRAALQQAWKGVFEEDIFAVERMQAGRASPGYKGGAFSPVMDRPTLHFHRWVARKLAATTQ